MLTVVGGGAFVLPLLLVGFGLTLLWSERLELTLVGWLGSLLAILSVSSLLHLQFGKETTLGTHGAASGGIIGQEVSSVLGTYFGATGAAIILGAMLLVAFLLLVPVARCSLRIVAASRRC